MTDLAEREARVKAHLKKLGLDKKTDLKVILTKRVKYGSTRTFIHLNPDLSDDEFDVTLAHELLHYFGIPHNETTRSIRYHSKSLRKDLLSKTLAQMMKA
jgi:Zn-dependent peptidase ImmA (M78 family)